MQTQPDPISAGILVGVLTLLAGFGAWALGHWLFLRLASPEHRNVRGWTEYKAAFWGDLLVLPVINGLMIWILSQLSFDPIGAYWLPILVAVMITIFVHYEQASLGHTNWTMPRPWRWNSFGLYHALFMAVNLILVGLFIEQLIIFLSDIAASTSLSLGLFGILLGWLTMLAMFFVDRTTLHR